MSTGDDFLDAPGMLATPIETPVHDVYVELDRAQAHDIVLMERGLPKMYVNGFAFIGLVLARYQSEPSRGIELFDMPIGLAVSRFQNPSDFAVPIGPSETNPKAMTPDGGESMTPVIKAGRSVPTRFEYFLRVGTKRIVYVCGNGHRNSNPDRGTCYYCPSAVTAEEED